MQPEHFPSFRADIAALDIANTKGDAPFFEPFMNADDVASLLDLHPKTVLAMARTGQLPAIRLGKYWRFRASQLEDWVTLITSQSCPRTRTA